MTPRRPDDDQPALGALIETARHRLRPRLSQDAAGKEAGGMSGTRWRQIVKGSMSSKGFHRPSPATDVQWARMALVVGLTPQELDDAGEPGVAAELQELLAAHTEEEVLPPDLAEFLADRPHLLERFREQSPAVQRRLVRLMQQAAEEHAALRRRQDEQLAAAVDEWLSGEQEPSDL